jgi:hypothetical protein
MWFVKFLQTFRSYIHINLNYFSPKYVSKYSLLDGAIFRKMVVHSLSCENAVSHED